MTTFKCTLNEFRSGVIHFMNECGFKHNSQEGIANMHKGLCLLYLGIIDSEEQEIAAIHLKVATVGAIRRGWSLARDPMLSSND